MVLKSGSLSRAYPELVEGSEPLFRAGAEWLGSFYWINRRDTRLLATAKGLT